MTNTNNIPKVYFCYLANILANTNGISKVDPYHLANTPTNINNKANNFIKEVLLYPTNNSLLNTK